MVRAVPPAPSTHCCCRSVYYGLGAILVVAATARSESDDRAEPWEYIWSDTGRGWALGVIVWRSLRAWMINPFLLVVDIGVSDPLGLE